MEALRSDAFAGLLRLVETLRSFGLESQRLHHELGQWMRERRILAAQPGEGTHKRGQDAKRPSRRALRCEFYAKVSSGHAQQREDLVLLFQSVPGEATVAVG